MDLSLVSCDPAAFDLGDWLSPRHEEVQKAKAGRVLGLV